MTGAGGEREDRGVGACSNNHITSTTSLARPDPTSTTDGVIADGPLEVTDSQRSEGSLGDSCDVGIGNILHNPDVLLEVVTDNSLLYPNIGDHGVRRILYLVGLIKERVFTETSQCYHRSLKERIFNLTGGALLAGAGILVDVLIPGNQPEIR